MRQSLRDSLPRPQADVLATPRRRLRTPRTPYRVCTRHSDDRLRVPALILTDGLRVINGSGNTGDSTPSISHSMSTGAGDSMGQEDIRRILKARRARLNPEDVGLEPRPKKRRGPQVKGLTQFDIDVLMRRGAGTYSRVESGRLTPSREYVADLAKVLRLDEATYVHLHLEWFHEAPLPRNPGPGSLPPAWQRVLDGQQSMAYVNDGCYRLIAFNQEFASMFPSGTPPRNTMEWMLLSEEARDFCLVDWDTAWGPLVVPQFRAALAAYPEDADLQSIQARVLEDERARRLFDQPERTYIHPDGDRRPLHHAKRGLGFATMIVAQPVTLPGGRYMTVLFDPADAIAA